MIKKTILLGVVYAMAFAMGGYFTLVGFLMGSNFDEVKTKELNKIENYVVQDCNNYNAFASYTRTIYVGPSDAEIALETFMLANDMIFTD